MGQVSAVLRKVAGGHSHWCPGCEEMHVLPNGWTFDGNVDRPTYSPSFKHTGVAKRDTPEGWVYPRDDAGKPLPRCCHYFIRAGRIEFCADSTHPLAGQTVDLPALPAHLRDT